MLRSIAVLFATLSIWLNPTQASARLMEASLPVPTDVAHEAIHMPTGCVARVVLSDEAFVKAWITDPDCLPIGVTDQVVPAQKTDFWFVSKGR